MRSVAAEQGASNSSPLSYRPEASSDLLPLSLVKDADGIELAFGWQKGTTAAVFLRSGWLWTIFEDSRRVDLSAVERSVAEGNSGPLRSAEQMDAQALRPYVSIWWVLWAYRCGARAKSGGCAS
ncbi:hypothetical protein JCM17846_07060 [Iodidimonas nitroreducens]|uniref:Uncharacterized protein n=1 Tax=Iodidimonas nitroreducens TaxID=1236968 RepID=A0A5A7N5M6_9PROT|nr:hypothetical protein [Iodidimonas nitroreducens]GER03024.1 hypothetical protein JCM17846_07060 [Iodidimonas nitroreducens]